MTAMPFFDSFIARATGWEGRSFFLFSFFDRLTCQNSDDNCAANCVSETCVLPQHGAECRQMATYRLPRPVSDKRPGRYNSFFFMRNDTCWSRFHLKGVAFSKLGAARTGSPSC